MRETKKKIRSDCRRAMLPAAACHTFGSMLGSVLGVYLSYVLGHFADAAFQQDQAVGFSDLYQLLICVCLSVILVPVIGGMGDVVMLKQALKHDRIVLGRYLDKNYLSAMGIEVGDVQYRLENDVNNLRCEWVELVRKLVVIPITLLLVLYSTLRISWLYTVVVFGLAMLKLIIPFLVRKIQAQFDKDTRNYGSQVRAYETMITKKPDTVKLFGLSNYFIRQLHERYQKFYSEVFRREVRFSVLTDGASALIDTLCTISVLFTGAVFVARGDITPGAIVSMLGYYTIFNGTVQKIGEVITTLPIMQNMVERIEVLYTDEEDMTGSRMEPFDVVTLSELSYAYKEERVLQNVNLRIKSGEKVVIVGENGSGKSTLIKILCGLLKGYEGSIRIGDQELNSISMRSWREQIAYVPQEPFLFGLTVEQNIHIVAPSASAKEVEQVMELLHISHLRGRIASGNDAFSGGEKQKIALARALLREPSIILMDEPSNSLDLESVEWLREFICHVPHTVIYVSHDQSLCCIADVVLALPAGIIKK